MSRDLGDFQTPPELAEALVRRLGPIGDRWPRVLEPTCGRGNFLRAVLGSPSPPREAIGVELQPAYCDEARAADDDRATIIRADLFSLDLRRLPWRGDGPILVVGNPPWVTNAELGRLGSDNRPPRRNVKGLGGLDARTGAANFDLAEAVWLKLIAELSDQTPTIALLCKTAVAKAVFDHVRRAGPAMDAELIEIDARRWFGASVAAGFLVATIGGPSGTGRVAVYPGLDAAAPSRTMGVVRGRFAADYDTALALEFAIGPSAVIWRQGIKHDVAPVMELVADGPSGPFRNGLGEVVDLEPDRLYPLVKGADLKRPPGGRPRRALVVTQEKLGDDTSAVAASAPKLWAYLNAHADRFRSRRSSIYEGRPPFALFGIGPYTFAPYKVAVAGVHRPTRFRAIGPEGGRPTVLDDTCYMLPCGTAVEAAAIAAILNDPIAIRLLAALAPPEAKRPVTKNLLQAIDPAAVLARADLGALVERAVATLREDLGERSEGLAAAVQDALADPGLLLSGGGGPTLGPSPTSPERPTRPDEES